jgi:hypothetical protein
VVVKGVSSSAGGSASFSAIAPASAPRNCAAMYDQYRCFPSLRGARMHCQ